jgi:hypothetical protein
MRLERATVRPNDSIRQGSGRIGEGRGTVSPEVQRGLARGGEIAVRRWTGKMGLSDRHGEPNGAGS